MDETSMSAEGFTTAAERIANTLRQRIVEGTLRPGDRLVTATLAEEFGVSRMPVRDALKLLEKDGLAEGRPMYGHRVVRPSGEAIEGLMHLRQALECKAAALCAARATAGQLVRLEELARQADEDTSASPRPPAAVEIAFHTKLAEVAGFAEITKALTRVLTLIATFFTPRAWIEGDVPHQEIVRAMAERDPAKAEQAMHRHINFAMREFGVPLVNDLLERTSATEKRISTKRRRTGRQAPVGTGPRRRSS